MIINDPNKPLLNRATNGIYPPGSIFKMVVLIELLERNLVETSTVSSVTRSKSGKLCNVPSPTISVIVVRSASSTETMAGSSALLIICKSEYLNELLKIYDDNNLSYTYKKFSNKKSLDGLLPFLKNDKKNDDEKINFILLNKIGKTSMPNKFKISIKELKKYTKKII